MFQDMLKDKMSSVRNASSDDLLAALGLERSRSTVAVIASTAAVLTVGMALGAGIALLFAPKSGRALRQDLKARANDVREHVTEKADQAAHEIRSALSMEDNDKQRAQPGQKREENAHRRA